MSTKVLQSLLQRLETEFTQSRYRFILPPRPWHWITLGAILIACCVYEIRTASLQARVFARLNSWLVYDVAPGPSARMAFPRGGPFDARRGYNRIPDFEKRLLAAGYHVVEQARPSRGLARLIALGVSPPERETAAAGLAIRSADGTVLYDFTERDQSRHFNSFAEIPPLLINSLLFIENRELNAEHASGNPAIEWNRLAKALLSYTGGKLGLPVPTEGGSTLAVQIEKFRHSPAGRTSSPAEKLRQIVGASLKVYRDGPDTTDERRAIVTEYLNTLPLAAAPGYGEVYGLGEALQAWFGLELEDVIRALADPAPSEAKIHAYKHTLALLLATRAPSALLASDHAALGRKTDQYTRLLAKAGVIDQKFADALLRQPLIFPATALPRAAPLYVRQKGAATIRNRIAGQLGVPNLYSLDRLDLTVATTLDARLQQQVSDLLRAAGDPAFVRANGLNQEQLLENADPRKVIYTFLLLERTSQGNLVRVQADNSNTPLDFNHGIKLELGSTAKLRTLIHYLEIVAQLHRELAPLSAPDLAERAAAAHDPITQWAIKSFQEHPGQSLNAMLLLAMERRYSASPYENFFTGGGVHAFHNFDPSDNGRIVTLREGFQRSVNLVFIRLMREVVSFHRARLSYDADAVLNDIDNPLRRHMLDEIAESESKATLRRAYKAYAGLESRELVGKFLQARNTSARHLTILYFAWHRAGDIDGLDAWLKQFIKAPSADEVQKLFKAYSNPRLTLADYGYLLSRHPLDLWCAGELFNQRALTWDELWNRSGAARPISSAWLFKTRNRAAQDLRLRIRIEADAFSHMTPDWQRLGFPFSHLVPSLATAIGSSSDRPAALADLMGIIVNDGVRRSTSDTKELRFAPRTPYETVLAPVSANDERVLDPAVARIVRQALRQVVELGTAKRVAGAFVTPDGVPLAVGGKTGSGDNRFDTFNRYGGVTSSRVTSRTAAFVFYLGDRYVGVITASVSGADANRYRFTSALPVSILKLAAPALNKAVSVNPDSQFKLQQVNSLARPKTFNLEP